MDDTVEVTRDDVMRMMREFLRRMHDNDVQEVLSDALLLDLALETDNAALVLGVSDSQLREAGELMRKSYRAFQSGDRGMADTMARTALALIDGQTHEQVTQ